MMRTEFEMSDNNYVDPVSGYAVNMPLGPQDYPGWQEDRPDVVEQITGIRRLNEIVVPDDEFSPKFELVPAPPPKNCRKAPPPKRARS